MTDAPVWRGARVAVFGLARSGVAASLFLHKRGARVVAIDRRTAADLGTIATDLQAAGIELSLGGHPDLSGFEAVVLSPGVDPTLAVIEDARARGVRILPELELGALAFPGRMVCITGTKGKSTTTASLAAMLREAGLDARAVGNIGEPITAHIDEARAETIFVTEVSSFQLETTQDLRAHCAVFLNFFPDHLDRHPTLASYAEAKARVFRNQTPQDLAVINAEDATVVSLAARTRARILPFHPRNPLDAATTPPGAGFVDGRAVLREAFDTTLFASDDVAIPGAAVRANLLAAAATAASLGADPRAIRQAVRAFRGVRHTFEKVGECRGVAFFNDSKATTLESVQVALESFDTPVIAILGGRLKAGSFRALRDAVSRNVKAIHAIGESRGLVAAALGDLCPVREALSLEEAVTLAHQEAVPGDTILLSPGCASFDMFRDYAARGDAFRRAFERLSMQGAA
jgi:UDP-N-acetylmuramoylalanine--D-glutamate ligase